MDAVTYAKRSLSGTFDLLNSSLDGMDEAQYNFNPPGSATSAAKTHVHIVSSVDFFINALAAGGKPSWGEVAQAHGLPANPLEIWKHAGAIPMAAMKDLQKKVFDSALAYVGTLSDSDLDREVDTQFFGKKDVAFLLQLSALHTAGHAGDIAAVKGVQGLKGLPF
jgi:hypothetical protein